MDQFSGRFRNPWWNAASEIRRGIPTSGRSCCMPFSGWLAGRNECNQSLHHKVLQKADRWKGSDTDTCHVGGTCRTDQQFPERKVFQCGTRLWWNSGCKAKNLWSGWGGTVKKQMPRKWSYCHSSKRNGKESKSTKALWSDHTAERSKPYLRNDSQTDTGYRSEPVWKKTDHLSKNGQPVSDRRYGADRKKCGSSDLWEISTDRSVWSAGAARCEESHE